MSTKLYQLIEKTLKTIKWRSNDYFLLNFLVDKIDNPPKHQTFSHQPVITFPALLRTVFLILPCTFTGSPAPYAAFHNRNSNLLIRVPRSWVESCDCFMEKSSHFAMAFQWRMPLQFGSNKVRPHPFSIPLILVHFMAQSPS